MIADRLPSGARNLPRSPLGRARRGCAPAGGRSRETVFIEVRLRLADRSLTSWNRRSPTNSCPQIALPLAAKPPLTSAGGVPAGASGASLIFRFWCSDHQIDSSSEVICRNLEPGTIARFDERFPDPHVMRSRAKRTKAHRSISRVCTYRLRSIKKNARRFNARACRKDMSARRHQHSALRCLAETEGFEPSIRLYSV